MNSKLIYEKDYGNDFSYILLDNNMFSLTEYKVLQSQSDEMFIKCMKMLHNGKIQIYYVPGEYKRLKNLIRSMSSENARSFITNFLKDIVEIKNNGFLSCHNIDFSLDKIFVNVKEYNVKLTYLPLAAPNNERTLDGEKQLREKMVSVINEFSMVLFNGINILTRELLNAEEPIEDIYHKILNKELVISATGGSTAFIEKPLMKLVSVNTDIEVEAIITKDVFILGRNTFTASGDNVFNNKLIGRIHCKIEKANGKYYVEDLNSVNGTFLNDAKLDANCRQPVENGDSLRLANTEFRIVIV